MRYKSEKERKRKIFHFIKYYDTESVLSPHIDCQFHFALFHLDTKKKNENKNENESNQWNAYVYVSEFIEQMFASVNANVMLCLFEQIVSVSIWNYFELHFTMEIFSHRCYSWNVWIKGRCSFNRIILCTFIQFFLLLGIGLISFLLPAHTTPTNLKSRFFFCSLSYQMQILHREML